MVYEGLYVLIRISYTKVFEFTLKRDGNDHGGVDTITNHYGRLNVECSVVVSEGDMIAS